MTSTNTATTGRPTFRMTLTHQRSLDPEVGTYFRPGVIFGLCSRRKRAGTDGFHMIRYPPALLPRTPVRPSARSRTAGCAARAGPCRGEDHARRTGPHPSPGGPLAPPPAADRPL